MKRSLFVMLALASAGCGDDRRPGLDYTNPPKGGALRLVRSKTAAKTNTELVLDLVVGDQPLTGYSVGFDLPVGEGVLRVSEFLPGTALDPGVSPPAAKAVVPTRGPLAGTLVAALSQKASGPGAVATDTTLPPGSVLFTIRLDRLGSAPDGVVVDGTAADFHLPSGGMRDRSGTTVVAVSDVAIGILEVHR